MESQEAMTLPADAGAAAARTYLTAHDARVKLLDVQPLHVLRTVWTGDLELQGMTSLMGGPQSHDELVNYVSDLEFPDAERARRIYHEWVLVSMPAIGQE